MIDSNHVINLRGRDYPLWAGILDAATKAGLVKLTTRVLQIPDSSNGQMAVVEATAEFSDGRIFTDIGDCSPASTTPQLAAAALRLASTRAKGRCLRDAINCGATMYEELPDTEKNGGFVPVESAPALVNGNSHRPMECSNPGCGKPLTQGQQDISLHGYGQPLCPSCQKQFTRIG